MVKIKRNAATLRFIAEYERLLRDEVINSQKDFCEQIAYKSTSFNAVLKGKRNIPLSAINSMSRVFGVDRDEILDGVKKDTTDNSKPVGNQYTPDAKAQLFKLKNLLELKEIEINRLKRELQDKDEFIYKILNPDAKPDKGEKVKKH